MTEKRSDYRRRRGRKHKGWHNLKAAFSDQNDPQEPVAVNPDFQRSEREKHAAEQKAELSPINLTNSSQVPNEKGLRLKKRLNRAIIIVALLIVLVLWALFNL